MKKYLLFALVLALFSCDDGDLQIETVDFDSIETVQSCETVVVNAVNVLFKINGDEALILELPSNLLKNEITTTDIVSKVPSEARITYRIFSDNVSDDYFCNAVPVLTPTVIEDIPAQNGQVFITTTVKVLSILINIYLCSSQPIFLVIRIIIFYIIVFSK